MRPCSLLLFCYGETSVHDLVMKALHIEHYFLVGKAFTILQSIGNQGLVWWRPRKRKRKRKVRSHVTQQPFAIGCWGAQVDKMYGAAFPR
jgi:hypothetical protein